MEPHTGSTRLESWKEIAAYLRRDVTTVQRWERLEGLPVHRHLHDRQASVYAYVEELDEWRRTSRNGADGTGVLVAQTRRVLRHRWGTLSGWAAAGAIAVIWLLGRNTLSPASPKHLNILPSAGERFSLGGITLSPNGSDLVYAAEVDGKQRLFVRPLRKSTATELAGTEGARAPFFSPDGKWIGFFTATALNKIGLDGGAVVKISDVVGVTRGGVWIPDGRIIYSPSQSDRLWQIPNGGGTPRPLSTIDPAGDEGGHLWPQLLPDGRSILFTIRKTTSALDDGKVAVQPLDSSDHYVVIADGGFPRYSPSGDLLFVSHNIVKSVRLEPNPWHAVGTPVPVVDHVIVHRHLGGAYYAIGPDGTLVYEDGSVPWWSGTLVRVDWAGRETVLVQEKLPYMHPRLSPDGLKVALSYYGATGANDVWIADLITGLAARFTQDEGDEWNSCWTRNGRELVYTWFRPGATYGQLFSRSLDSASVPKRVTANQPGFQFAGSFSPDGTLAFGMGSLKSNSDIWIASPDEPRSIRPFIATRSREYGPEFSHDGRWMAYVSNATGTDEVYLTRYPNQTTTERISRSGGWSPVWSPDDGYLFYVEQRKLMAVRIDPRSEFPAGPPAILFQGSYMLEPEVQAPRRFDVFPDGRSFAMVRREPDAPPQIQIHVVTNWTAAR
jgi:Tol biopolymer transport system component